MLRLLSATVLLVFITVLFTLWLLVEHEHATVDTNRSNTTVWPTLRRNPKCSQDSKADPLRGNPALLALRTLARVRRGGKPSRRERKLNAKHGMTTTVPTRRTARQKMIKKRMGKPTKRAYTLDINSEDYSIKKHGNWSANPAQYAYEERMSASRYVKSILVKDIRKQFFNITAHRTKLSQLEILKNQSKPLYDNYMKIINKSTTINWWRKLRNARYNNTSPLHIDPWATLDELYKSYDVYGGTTPTAAITIAASIVKYYKTLVVETMKKISKGPVIYDEKDILGSSGIVSLN